MGAFFSCCFENNSPSSVEIPNERRYPQQRASTEPVVAHYSPATISSISTHRQSWNESFNQYTYVQVQNDRSRDRAPTKHTQGRGGRGRSRSSQRRHRSLSAGQAWNARHSSVGINNRVPISGGVQSGYSQFDLESTMTIPKYELKKFIPKYWLKNYNETDCGLREMTSENNIKYYKISQSFKKSTQDNLTIEKIERVENIYLWLMYQLKLEEIRIKTNIVHEYEYFHGTKLENLSLICLNNFNWRRFGENTGHKFGQGVSFSPLVSYASHYTDEKKKGEGFNQMILASVVVTNSCEGDRNMSLPPDNCDTTTNSDGKVKVKYDDHTMYPAYVITYSGNLPHICKQNKENMYYRDIQVLQREINQI